jgi:phosphohistidine phosphatase SixA
MKTYHTNLTCRRIVFAVALVMVAAFAVWGGRAGVQPVRAGALAGSGATIIVLVRHGEKADDDPQDPSLSPAGQARAQALVAVLDGAPVAAVYATEFKRTRQTAQPLAARSRVPITVRPVNGTSVPTYAANLAREILTRHANKTVVIVGHSNTVPELVRALSGRPVPALTENDFDRLFLVVRPTVSPVGSARLFQTRYGPPNPTVSD